MMLEVGGVIVRGVIRWIEKKRDQAEFTCRHCDNRFLAEVGSICERLCSCQGCLAFAYLKDGVPTDGQASSKVQGEVGT